MHRLGNLILGLCLLAFIPIPGFAQDMSWHWEHPGYQPWDSTVFKENHLQDGHLITSQPAIIHIQKFRNPCPAATLRWGAGNACSASVGEGREGDKHTVFSTLSSDVDKSATLTCKDGAWKVEPGWTCVPCVTYAAGGSVGTTRKNWCGHAGIIAIKGIDNLLWYPFDVPLGNDFYSPIFSACPLLDDGKWNLPTEPELHNLCMYLHWGYTPQYLHLFPLFNFVRNEHYWTSTPSNNAGFNITRSFYLSEWNLYSCSFGSSSHVHMKRRGRCVRTY